MLRLTFVGDIACDRPLLKSAKNGNEYDFSDVFHTERTFADSDFVIGNLETCFGGGPRYGYKPYHYSVPDSFCTAVRGAGIDLVSTANNHCMDEGVEGLIRTLDVLDCNNIMYTGTFRGDEKQRFCIKEIKGVKIAFYSMTYSVNTCYEASSCKDLSRHINIVGYKTKSYSDNRLVRYLQTVLKPNFRKVVNKLRANTIILASTDHMSTRPVCDEWLAEIDENIRIAREQADVLVVLLHSGGQFNEEPGEYSVFMMDHLCGLGADIIIGNHPHTVQRIENRNGKVVAYSLGGYSLSPSGEYLVRRCLPEYSAALHVDLDDSGKILGTDVQVFQCVEDPKHYLRVIEADENDASVQTIKSRLRGAN